MISVIKSSYAQRIMRCGDVFSDSRIKEPHLHKLVNDFTLLAEKLIELCNKPITGNSSVSTLCTELTLHSFIIINQLNNLSGTSSRLQQLFMRSVYDIVNHSPKLIPKIYYYYYCSNSVLFTENIRMPQKKNVRTKKYYI